MEARAAGASAILLIVRALVPDTLQALARAAAGWHLPTLIEVHSAAELEPALAAGPGAIGVNARDLATFAVDLRRGGGRHLGLPHKVAGGAGGGDEKPPGGESV